MSRICKKPIKVPQNVIVAKDGNVYTVTGPKGTLSIEVNPVITSDQIGDEIIFKCNSNLKRDKALYGLYAMLIKNMVAGVTEGFSKKLVLVGIGYRADLKGNKLFLSVGYSHPIIFSPPENIKIEIPSDTTIVVSGIDKQLVGEVSAKIRSFRKPEPYKGKGIKYEGEFIKRKAGKAAAK